MLWRIYRYYNPIEKKSYIGQTTTSIKQRARKGDGYRKGTPLREAIDKFGFENLEQSILRLCTSQEEADKYERYFIEKYNTIYPNGYNLQDGGRIGQTSNDLSKKRISESHIGKKATDEARNKISSALKDYCSQEKVKQQRSEIQKKSYQEHPERRKQASERSKKMWENEDYKQLMSDMSKQRWEDESYRQNISEYTRKWHLEHKEETHDWLWWNNGKECKRCKDSPGPEWVKGRLPFNKEWIEKKAQAQIGKHWYNNGKESVLAFSCPEGFIPGRLKKV